jgi:hypothetical protein
MKTKKFLPYLVSFVLGAGILFLTIKIIIKDNEGEIKRLILEFEDEVSFDPWADVEHMDDYVFITYPSSIPILLIGPKVVPYLIERLKKFNNFSAYKDHIIGHRDASIECGISKILHLLTDVPLFDKGMKEIKSTKFWLKWWEENKDKVPLSDRNPFHEIYKSEFVRLDKAIRSLIIHFRKSKIMVAQPRAHDITCVRPGAYISDSEGKAEDGWYIRVDVIYVVLRYLTPEEAKEAAQKAKNASSNGRYVFMRDYKTGEQVEPLFTDEEVKKVFLSWQPPQ